MKLLLLKISKEIAMRQASGMEGSKEKKSRYKLLEIGTSLACAMGNRNAGVIDYRNKE